MLLHAHGNIHSHEKAQPDKCQPHLESSNGWEAHVQWRHDRCLSLVPTTTFTIPLLPNMVDLGEIVEEP